MKWRPEGYERRIHGAIMQCVKPEDVLLHLGDVSLGDDEGAHREYIMKWPGKKILIRGNHDSRSDVWYYGHGWDTVCTMMMIERFGKKILFSHIPQQDLGWFDINVFGHFHDNTHATIREKEPEIASILCSKHILLAVEEINYQPILLDTFYQKAINKKPRYE